LSVFPGATSSKIEVWMPASGWNGKFPAAPCAHQRKHRRQQQCDSREQGQQRGVESRLRDRQRQKRK
jgi:hypothetical protein